VGGTDTGPTVLDGLAMEESVFPMLIQAGEAEEGVLLGDREFGEVVADHLGLDFDLVELLARVDTDDGANHLGDDNHITEVSLDEVGALVGLGLLLGLAELLDQTHGLALETAVESAAGTGVDDIAELLGREVKEPEEMSMSMRLGET
jgi:hypothetical protein